MGMTISALSVRRSIQIQASPQRVWEEFETFDRIAAWFGRGHELHRFEAKLGGSVDLSIEAGGARRHFGGPVIVLERGREVSIENNWEAPHAWPVPTFLTLRLTPSYDGTLVEILHHGFERLGAAAADSLESYEEGWDMRHLSALREIVEHD